MTETQVRPEVPAAAPAPARRRSRRKLQRWLAFGAAIGAAGYWVGWHSSATLVRDLQVVAPKSVSGKAVVAAAGIDAQDHVPAIDPGQVRIAVMEALPAVADVRVARRLPHKIRLTVTARVPFAALQTKSGYLVLDAGGVAFQRVRDPGGLPVVNASKDPGRATAIAVLGSLPEKLQNKVVELSASTADNVTLKLKGGAKVRWGAASDAALKARVLSALLQVGAQEYDVSAPLLPTTTGSLEPSASPSPQ